jgi:ParB/RepB/Spo0J family partition protein
MASTTNTSQRDHVSLGRAELREIPLSRIVVADGFNPRGEVVEDDALRELAETMRQRGCLQPIRVQSTESGDFLLVAGERRYRAAALAALTSIPASVLPAGTGDESEQLELLVEAMIENELRSDLNPLQRAQGYQAMIDGGLNVRGVAERLGGKAKRGSRERRIRQQLAILSLPQDLAKLVATEKIPLLAVKCLVELSNIHEDLARTAVNAVLNPPERCEPYTWAEVLDDPLLVAVRESETLPAGLFSSATSHPIEAFTLGEKAQKDLAAYEKLSGATISGVRFSPDLIEQVRPLGGVHDCDYYVIIAGQELADRLAEDYIAKTLKERRAFQRRMTRNEANDDASAGNAPAVGAGESTSDTHDRETPQQRAEREKREADAKRAQEKEQREQAVKYNVALGLLAFKHLPKLKVDQRVLRILASVDLGSTLTNIAARGARLALPGWVTQNQQANGKTKTGYLEDHQAAQKAATFLEGAQSASDIAGRAFTLIALASLVDQAAVAFSRRSYYELSFAGPWAVQAERDLNAIVRERITEGQLPELDVILGDRIAADEQAEQIALERQQARDRIADISARFEDLDDEGLDAALEDARLAWGRYDLKTHTLQDRVTELRKTRAATSAAEATVDPNAEPVAAAA